MISYRFKKLNWKFTHQSIKDKKIYFVKKYQIEK